MPIPPGAGAAARQPHREPPQQSHPQSPHIWALDPDAPEAKKGFLLNHLIHELLPPKGDGLRWSNSDPVTGQAAWYDLRVRVEKTAPPADAASQPETGTQASPVGQGPATIRFGHEEG